jgi:hypothetical protein
VMPHQVWMLFFLSILLLHEMNIRRSSATTETSRLSSGDVRRQQRKSTATLSVSGHSSPEDGRDQPGDFIRRFIQFEGE